MLHRTRTRLLLKDFDAWAYDINWPQHRAISPMTGTVDFVVEDIKFAYNAWCLLRLAMFFGVRHPKVLSSMTNTTPSMDILHAGNRLFFMNARVEAHLNPAKVRLALTPNHPRAFPIQQFDWNTHCTAYRPDATGVEIVLGMENGLSPEIADSCDYCSYIPQYGSIGSLSMLSALAIAAHTLSRQLSSASSRRSSSGPSSVAQASLGHMPLSHNPFTDKATLPHEADLLTLSNTAIKSLLEKRRQRFSLQLSVLIYNELGDRNIGAVMRNANVYNCEHVLILNRRKYNKRGAVGTQKVLDVHFLSSVYDKEAKQLLEGYEVWLLYPYYPNLLIYSEEASQQVDHHEATFLRHGDPRLRRWCCSDHRLTAEHPLSEAYPNLASDAVYLDRDASLHAAVQSVKRKGLKGVMLAVPEEGSSPHPSLAHISHRVVYVSSPSVLPLETQRGLNPALSTAIAFERIRSAIDVLS